MSDTDTKRELNVLLWRGDPIPGSKLFRDFCSSCKEAIRVSKDDLKKHANYCSDCRSPIGSGTPYPSVPHSQRNYDGGTFGAGEW